MSSVKLWKGCMAATFATLALVALVLTGCGGGTSGGTGTTGTAKEGGTLNVSDGEENISLNPLVGYVPADVNVMSNINETLWKENFQGKVVPWLVKSFQTTNEDRVWTLHLKEGIKFSNGKAMTSADVAWSLQKGKESELYGSLFADLSFKATDPSTVVISSTVPAPEIPLLLSQWTFAVLPKDFAGMTEEEFGDHPIGTGPFKLASWNKGESLTLEKNQDYWQKGLPHLEKVVFHTVEDPNSRVSQLRGGQLDLIYAPPWEQLEGLEGGETSVGNYPLGVSYLIILNVRRPLFANEKAREAVNLALDREGMVQAALHGYGETAGAYVSPPVYGYNPNIKAPEQDIPKAKELLSEAVKEGVNPTFTMLVFKELPFWATAAQIVQQNLEEAGFHVSLKKVDNNTAVTLASKGEFDAGAYLNYEPAATSSELFTFYNSFEGNWSGADTSEMEKLLPEAQQEVNNKKRERLYWHMQEIVEKENNLVLVAYSPYVWGLRNDVTGFFVGNAGIPWFAETALTE